MSNFVDRLLVHLSDPTNLSELLVPASDTNHARILALLNAVYDLPFATVHNVLNVQVLNTEFQKALFPPHRTSGTWTQTIPGYIHTDVLYNQENPQQPTWLDISARIALTLVLEVDAGKIEEILTTQITDFTTLQDFENHFQFIDLPAFMEKHGITTVDELREAFQYLMTEIRLQTPSPFDPNNPANQHRYRLNVAVLIRDAFDLAAALRDAKLTRSLLEHTLTYRGEYQQAEVRTPYAFVVIFPTNSLPGAPLTESAVQAFYAAEGVLALFVTPP